MKNITDLKDLIGLKVKFEVWGEDDKYKEVVGYVYDAHLEMWYFYEKLNEPISTSLKFLPLPDLKYYKHLTEEEYQDAFNETHPVESITEILNKKQ